ncbi:AT-rich interactive domain-containing protein 3A [Saguinus oedipus]|uniref:AT-rich interactive domain-containing protein 3A n=1 Tax=Saguinus oedipus TaxID=9490 RepID=A0ABQ9TQY8_SAGOE|nr:AT-rich interactive domain-containing protein 3A [Saguinus oedipus]
MKLQAVMETLLQRQQRARQELEARQQLPPEPPAAPPSRARATADEDREPESARMQRAQMAALAAMRAAAAGLGHPASPGGSEDGPPGSEEEDAAREGTPASPTVPGGGREGPGEEHFEDVGSDEDMKPKWEEEEMEEDLGEDEEEEEDYEEEEEEEEDEEGLGPPGPASLSTSALFPRKSQPPQAFRGSDGVPRALGGQERPGPGPAHSGGATYIAPQLQPPDHGDWTYEEQFKQVSGCVPRGGGATGSWAHPLGPLEAHVFRGGAEPGVMLRTGVPAEAPAVMPPARRLDGHVVHRSDVGCVRSTSREGETWGAPAPHQSW